MQGTINCTTVNSDDMRVIYAATPKCIHICMSKLDAYSLAANVLHYACRHTCSLSCYGEVCALRAYRDCFGASHETVVYCNSILAKHHDDLTTIALSELTPKCEEIEYG